MDWLLSILKTLPPFLLTPWSSLFQIKNYMNCIFVNLFNKFSSKCFFCCPLTRRATASNWKSGLKIEAAGKTRDITMENDFKFFRHMSLYKTHATNLWIFCRISYQENPIFLYLCNKIVKTKKLFCDHCGICIHLDAMLYCSTANASGIENIFLG